MTLQPPMLTRGGQENTTLHQLRSTNSLYSGTNGQIAMETGLAMSQTRLSLTIALILGAILLKTELDAKTLMEMDGRMLLLTGQHTQLVMPMHSQMTPLNGEIVMVMDLETIPPVTILMNVLVNMEFLR